MNSNPSRITGPALYALGVSDPCELIDGIVVAKQLAGGQQALITSRLVARLLPFVRNHHIGWVLTGGVGIYTARGPDRVRAPAVAVFTKEQLPDGPPSGFVNAVPELVIDIVAPEDSWSALQAQISEYQALGAGQVWIIDPSRQTLTTYNANKMRICREGHSISGAGHLQDFTLSLSELFSPSSI